MLGRNVYLAYACLCFGQHYDSVITHVSRRKSPRILLVMHKVNEQKITLLKLYFFRHMAGGGSIKETCTDCEGSTFVL